MSQEKFWNDNAATWATVIENNLIASREITNQAIVHEITALSPHSVLDIGCGEGWLSVPMHAQQINYTGTDGSQNLINIAQQKRMGSFFCVSYSQIAQHDWQPQQKFDVVVFNFSLLEENLKLLLQNTAAFLSSNGHILIQTLNPKNLPVYQDGWNEEDFKTMTIPFTGKMPWFGRTLESWHLLFKDCGLKLVKTTEPSLNNKLNDKPASVIFSLQKI